MLPALNYKRIVLAILLVIVSAGLLFGIIWLVFLRAPIDDDVPGTGVVRPGDVLPGTGVGPGGGVIGPGGILPGGEVDVGDGLRPGEFKPAAVADGSLTQVKSLTDERVKEVNLTGTGFSYLSGEDDKFYRLLLDGTKLPLSDEDFPYVESAVWSADSSKIILEYPDGANIIYDFNKNKKTTLPLGLEDPVFDSSSDKIAYKYIGSREEDNWLVVSDTDNSQAEAVEPIGLEGAKVQVSWSPNNQVVALFHDPIGLSREQVFFIGLHDENFKSLTVEGSNFEGKWSPDGNRILYHVLHPENDYNPVLWITDASINNIGNNNYI